MGEFFLFLFLIVLSAFFASAEVVFFSLNPYLLERSKSPLVKLVKRLISKPVELIVTILIGNELVNVLISSTGTKFLKDTLGDSGVVLGSFLISLLIFYFGEVIPKNIVIKFPEKLAPFYAFPIYLFSWLIYPIKKVLVLTLGGLVEKVEKKKEQVFSVEELVYNLEEGLKHGEYEKKEVELVKRLLNISETTVEEIMTPRTDIFALEEEKKVKETINDIIEAKHSKVPLYIENLDNITGILYIKDLLPVEDNLEKPLREFKKEVSFVPQLLDLETLLSDFKRKRTRIFMVVDEHGGTAGLVTYSDFLGWLLGGHIEEWGGEEIVEIAPKTYLVDASINIELLAEKLGLKLPEDYEYSTLGGFLMSLFKKLPEKGASVDFDNFRFVVQTIEYPNRIGKVKIIKRTENGYFKKGAE
jgi:putative hemolysin